MIGKSKAFGSRMRDDEQPGDTTVGMASRTPLLTVAPHPTGRTRRRAIGLAALALLDISWVAQSEVSQYVQTTLCYNKPFMVTWINHGACALLLPVLWACEPNLWRRLSVECRASLPRVLAMCAALSTIYTLGDDWAIQTRSKPLAIGEWGMMGLV